MAYNNDFYKQYEDYLLEPSVRKAHDSVLAITTSDKNFNSVIDFGCGQSNELYHFRIPKPYGYLGIDTNANERTAVMIKLLKADYRSVRNLRELLHRFKPSAFVSLFSSEITAPTFNNYTFYEKVFNEVPSIMAGLVSGFFYSSKKDKNPIEETGGIRSYQTLESIEDVQSGIFSEKRIILPVPSKMFGEDVFEVWKFFERK